MAYLPQIGLEYVEEDEATGDIAEIFDEIRRLTQLPYVPNGIKSASASPATLHAYFSMFKEFMSRTSLPDVLISVILYTVASSNQCAYCSTLNELSCRVYGIDDANLAAMINNVEQVTPERVRAIVRFVLKAVHSPKEVSAEDLDLLRAQGITDEEISEILFTAAMGMMNDILADTPKIETDRMVAESLHKVKAAHNVATT